VRIFTIWLVDRALSPDERERAMRSLARQDARPWSPADSARRRRTAEQLHERFPELTIERPDGTTLCDMRGRTWSDIRIAARMMAVSFAAWPDANARAQAWSRNAAYVEWLAAESGFALFDPATGKVMADLAAGRAHLRADRPTPAAAPPAIDSTRDWRRAAVGFWLVNTAAFMVLALYTRLGLARGSWAVAVAAGLFAAWAYMLTRYIRANPYRRDRIRHAVTSLGTFVAVVVSAAVLLRALSAYVRTALGG
jgi:hypothetical protein